MSKAKTINRLAAPAKPATRQANCRVDSNRSCFFPNMCHLADNAHEVVKKCRYLLFIELTLDGPRLPAYPDFRYWQSQTPFWACRKMYPIDSKGSLSKRPYSGDLPSGR
jgi:hypothetical protein